MSASITVTAQVMGRKKPVVADWRIPLNLAPAPTLRELISQIVRTEVESFRERQRERILTRVLSPSQIDAAAARGKIEMGGSESFHCGNAGGTAT